MNYSHLRPNISLHQRRQKETFPSLSCMTLQGQASAGVSQRTEVQMEAVTHWETLELPRKKGEGARTEERGRSLTEDRRTVSPLLQLTVTLQMYPRSTSSCQQPDHPEASKPCPASCHNVPPRGSCTHYLPRWDCAAVALQLLRGRG